MTEVADDRERDSRLGTVFGSYRLLSVLGRGGMGCVYLAQHTLIERKVALKMLHHRYASNPEAVQRMFAEARAVNRIDHENILQITDFCNDPSGDNYYVSELLHGENLQACIDRERILPLARSTAIVLQISSALVAAHDKGIVHCDLKPENIFLTTRSDRPDFVKLLDFGIARLLDEKDGALGHTAGAEIVGTPLYMSPEQAAGDPIDHRTDIYSLGVILYQLVTGKVPFIAKTIGQLVIKHTTATPVAPSAVADLPHAVPPELEALILACLAKDPAERPQTVAAVLARLAAIADALRLPVAATLVPLPAPPAGRRMAWIAATGALAIAVVVLGAVLLGRARPVLPPPTVAPPRPAAMVRAAPDAGVAPSTAAATVAKPAHKAHAKAHPKKIGRGGVLDLYN